jgi:hypothetical protein
MTHHWVLVPTVSVLLMFNVAGRAEAQTPSQAPAADSCASLTLPEGEDHAETIKIARVLNLCDDLHKVFDRAQTSASRLDLLRQQNVGAQALGADDVNRLLQQPDGQTQLLRQLADELQKDQAERNQLADELQSHLTAERVIAKSSALASDSNRMRIQVQSTLAEEESYGVESEFQRYQRTKFLNAFLGTTISTVGTGLQLNNSLHVQHAGDVLGVVGGGLTAFFNICTADWNVPDPAPSSDLLFRAFASDNRGALVPPTVWDSLDDTSKQTMQSIFGPNQGNTDLPLAHLSCHWGAGRGKAPTALAARIAALKQLDADLTNVNTSAIRLMQKVSSQ